MSIYQFTLSSLIAAVLWLPPDVAISGSLDSQTAGSNAYYEGDIAPEDLETFDLRPIAVDMPVVDAAPEVLRSPVSHHVCDAGCDTGYCDCQCVCSCCDECEEDCGEPWKLQDALMPCHSGSGIEFGGWIQGGIRTNDQGNVTQVGNAPSGGFTYAADEFNLHQLWLYAGKDANTGGCGTDWGFRFDYVFGADGPDTQAFGDIGWDTQWDAGGQYGSALPQLYVEGAWNDWNLIIGHFFTIIGYEVVQAPGNFFFTHSYQQYYAEPFTHTGVLVGYDINDNWSVTAGYTMGWDSGFNNANDANTFLGGVTWTNDNENTSVAYAVNVGRFGDGRVANVGDIYMHSVVLSHAFGDGWTAIIQHDLGINSDIPLPPPFDEDQWYGVGAYLLKEINCCWSAGARLEWFRDDNGTRVNPLGVFPPLVAGNYYEATLGLNWKPHTNLTVRPELRYDWYDGAGSPFDPVGGIGTADSLFTFGVDLFVTF